MRFNKRFTTAVHTLLIVAVHSQEVKVTSDLIAGKIGCHPVIIRNMMIDLKQAGFLHISLTDGMSLARPLGEISLADVMNVSEPNALQELRTAHMKVAKRCPTGQYLNEILIDYSVVAFEATMKELSKITLAETLKKLIAKEAEYPYGNPRVVLDEDVDILSQLE